jgi:hypothetical protein
MYRLLLISTLATGLSPVWAADEANAPRADARHPAIGSWYGKAVQVCGDPISSCPKASLYMTPTLTQDGAFLGNDTFALGGPPFGPHTTAHGNWTATSPTAITADYTFMGVSLGQTVFPSTTALRFRWQAEVIDADTMVGYVNIFTGDPVPTVWESLAENQFPTVPNECRSVVKKPAQFLRDPNKCTSYPASSCPLVFKFKILRIQGE